MRHSRPLISPRYAPWWFSPLVPPPRRTRVSTRTNLRYAPRDATRETRRGNRVDTPRPFWRGCPEVNPRPLPPRLLACWVPAPRDTHLFNTAPAVGS